MWTEQQARERSNIEKTRVSLVGQVRERERESSSMDFSEKKLQLKLLRVYSNPDCSNKRKFFVLRNPHLNAVLQSKALIFSEGNSVGGAEICPVTTTQREAVCSGGENQT